MASGSGGSGLGVSRQGKEVGGRRGVRRGAEGGRSPEMEAGGRAGWVRSWRSHGEARRAVRPSAASRRVEKAGEGG